MAWSAPPPSVESLYAGLAADVAELKRTLQAAVASQWKPIESAPKDGTEILGYAGGDVAGVEWRTRWGYWSLLVCGAHAEDGEWWPTHWMPIPPPPEITP